MSLFSAPPKSLCILRLSAIGDVCNAIAAVQAIEREWPETSLTWIAGKAEAPLLNSLLPKVKIVTYDKKQSIKSTVSVWRELKDQEFDALLHMQGAIRASILSLGIKADFKFGFDKIRSSDMQHLFTNVEVPSPSSIHVLDGFMAFAKTLGIKSLTPHWDIKLGETDREWAKAQINEQKTLILAPSSSKKFKNWHAEGYARVIEHAKQKGFHTVLIGGPAKNEIALGQEVESIVATPIQNLIGKTSLMQLLALIEQASLVIAPDSGPAHLANAINTPVIGLYAHHNPERTGPYRFKHYVVSAFEEALLAETGKTPAEVSWRKRVKDSKAMMRITPLQVINRFDEVIIKEGLV